ncbi:MAG: 50S ribosomal protein L25 [Cyanobacteria bacterium]|nr:50S ribosomal protein L25 [Cyanobacteriota bacterium]MDA0866199.1 50S ribosomal protein L25 [Cyanobacteriota bacterium]
MSISIDCSKRETGKNPRALRREGLVPAVLYGHNGTESIMLSVSAYDFEALRRKIKGKAPFTLNIPDLSWNGEVVLQEVQKHPWKQEIYHVSFFVEKPEVA